MTVVMPFLCFERETRESYPDRTKERAVFIFKFKDASGNNGALRVKHTRARAVPFAVFGMSDASDSALLTPRSVNPRGDGVCRPCIIPAIFYPVSRQKNKGLFARERGGAQSV